MRFVLLYLIKYCSMRKNVAFVLVLYNFNYFIVLLTSNRKYFTVKSFQGYETIIQGCSSSVIFFYDLSSVQVDKSFSRPKDVQLDKTYKTNSYRFKTNSFNSLFNLSVVVCSFYIFFHMTVISIFYVCFK